MESPYEKQLANFVTRLNLNLSSSSGETDSGCGEAEGEAGGEERKRNEDRGGGDRCGNPLLVSLK